MKVVTAAMLMADPIRESECCTRAFLHSLFGAKQYATPKCMAKSMETPTATDIVMDSKMLSFQPLRTSEPVVTEMIPTMVMIAYKLTRTFKVVNIITVKTMTMAIAKETGVPFERLFWRS